jgi:hypothetical protein
MYHQVRVDKNCRDYLRFMWWPDCQLHEPPQVYRMTVHLFGATSSPGCANYALKAAASTKEDKYGKKVADFVRESFTSMMESPPSIQAKRV